MFSRQEPGSPHVIDSALLRSSPISSPSGQDRNHVEFDRYGKYALVSLWEMDGAVIVYDAKT
ncbi:MAG: hypothetical protein IPN00_15095 [Hydrogenophilales bacterium]|nr:hypothetical protein [Hydrogenophilales bacterium]